MSLAPPVITVRTFLYLIIGNLLAWWLASVIGSPNLDGYNDMLETFVWGQDWTWSNFKHPPVAGWMTHLWFSLFPRTNASYYLLACANVAAGMTAIALIAREWMSKERVWLSILASLMAFPYSTLAYKYNANTILLLTWPWTTFFFLRSLKHREWWATLGLGLMGAVAMLSKYYTGVLLVSFLLASLLSLDGRAWLKTLHPYIASLIFALAMIPHVEWVIHHDFVTFKYVQEQGNGHTDYGQLLRFLLAPLMYWGLPWLLILWRCYEGPWEQRAYRSLAPKGWNDLLFWLCLFPWAISLAFGISGFVSLSLPWAIPIGFAYTLLWLRNAPDEVRVAQAAAGFKRFLPAYFLLVVAIAGILYGIQQALSSSRNYYSPTQEVTGEILLAWQRQHPGKGLGWVGGEWEANGMIPFYGDPAIIALPGVPNEFPATEAPVRDWEKMGGVMVCPDGPLNDRPDAECHSQIENWLKSLGQANHGQTLVISRTGWRFPRPIPFQYTIYWYDPQHH